MNLLKKFWYGKVLHKTYKPYAIVKDRVVIEIVYWNGDRKSYQFAPNTSMVLLHDDLQLTVGSRWDGTKWIIK